MQITEEAIEKVRESNRIKALIAAEFSKTTQTVENWLNAKNPLLTTAIVLQIIRQETGMTDEEILIEEVKA